MNACFDFLNYYFSYIVKVFYEKNGIDLTEVKSVEDLERVVGQQVEAIAPFLGPLGQSLTPLIQSQQDPDKRDGLVQLHSLLPIWKENNNFDVSPTKERLGSFIMQRYALQLGMQMPDSAARLDTSSTN